MERNKRRQLVQDLEELLDLVRYDGLLPASGQKPTEDLFQEDAFTRLPLSDASVVDTLKSLADELECPASRSSYEALLGMAAAAEREPPPQPSPVKGEGVESPPQPSPIKGEEVGSEPQTLALPLVVAPEPDPAAVQTTAAPEPVEVLSESLETHDAECLSNEVPLPLAAAETEADSDLDPFELAQTVTSQLMNRLDEHLAEHFPAAVHDSFAEFYFPFSAKVCERLCAEDAQTLVRLMSQEAAHDAG